MKIKFPKYLLLLSITLFIMILLYIFFPIFSNAINKTMDPNYPINKLMTGTVWGLSIMFLLGVIVTIFFTDFKKKDKNNISEEVAKILLKSIEEKEEKIKEFNLTIEEKERLHHDLKEKFIKLSKSTSSSSQDYEINKALNEGEFEEAEKLLLNKERKENKTLIDTYLKLGDISYLKLDFKMAISYYEKALALGDIKEKNKLSIAECYGFNGNPKKKLEILLSINKESLKGKYRYLILASIAKTYLVLENTKEALDYNLQSFNEFENQKDDNKYFLVMLNLDKSIIFYINGEYGKSLSVLNKVLTIYDKYLENDKLVLSSIYAQLGTIYSQIGEFKKSLEYSEKVLKIRMKLYDVKSLAVASSYCNIGSSYSRLGKNEKAIEYTQTALDCIEDLSENVDIDKSNFYNNIGYYYSHLKDPKNAIIYLEKSLKIRLEIFDECSIAIASTYMHLGSSYTLENNPDKGIEYLNKSLNIRKKLHHKNHPDIAAVYANLANAYTKKNDLCKAIRNNRKAHKIFKHGLGEINSESATQDVNLGSILISREKYEKSIFYLEKAKKVLIKTFDEKSFHVIYCYEFLSTSYMMMGKYEESIKYFERLKELNVLSNYEQLGLVYGAIGLENKSLEYLDKALFYIPNKPIYNETLEDINTLKNSLIK